MPATTCYSKNTVRIALHHHLANVVREEGAVGKKESTIRKNLDASFEEAALKKDKNYNSDSPPPAKGKEEEDEKEKEEEDEKEKG
jgi:hypothetical protein